MRAVRIGSLRLNVSTQDESLALVRRPARQRALLLAASFGFLNPHVYNLSAADLARGGLHRVLPGGLPQLASAQCSPAAC